MARIEFVPETEKRANEINRALLTGASQYIGGTVTYKAFPRLQLVVDDPRAAIDFLIEMEIIDPTKDCYIIHE